MNKLKLIVMALLFCMFSGNVNSNLLTEKLNVGINLGYFNSAGFTELNEVNLGGIRVALSPSIPEWKPNGATIEGTLQYYSSSDIGFKLSLSGFSSKRSYSYYTYFQDPYSGLWYYGGSALEKDSLSVTIINIGVCFLSEIKTKKVYLDINPGIVIFPTSLTIERSGSFLGLPIDEHKSYSSTGLGIYFGAGLDLVISNSVVFSTNIRYNTGKTSFKIGPYYVGIYGGYIDKDFSLDGFQISGGIKILL